MSNVDGKVVIERISVDGHWKFLDIKCHINGRIWFCLSSNKSGKSEDEAVSDLLDDFVSLLGHEHLKPKIIQCCHQLRQNDFSGNSRESMEFDMLPKEQLEPHFSCHQNEDFTTEELGINEISQSELQHKLSIVDETSKSIKVFEQNRCSVCIRSYKEILDENFHIVVPSCGHPLCCECADKILLGVKKECPRCRGNINSGSFNLMKFNADLEVETQDQTVFL